VIYLVESEGELLFVTSGWVYNGQSAVYRVDTKNRVREPVSSIGSRTLFLGGNRCISIDSNKVANVQTDSIYYTELSHIRSYDYEALALEEETTHVSSYGSLVWDNDHAFAIDKLLVEYCKIVEHSELHMVPPYGEHGYTNYNFYDAVTFQIFSKIEM
jgi:hypothetical protein